MVVTGLRSNKAYRFRLTAITEFGTNVAWATYTTHPEAPTTPRMVNSSCSLTKASVTLDWTSVADLQEKKHRNIQRLEDIFLSYGGKLAHQTQREASPGCVNEIMSSKVIEEFRKISNMRGSVNMCRNMDFSDFVKNIGTKICNTWGVAPITVGMLVDRAFDVAAGQIATFCSVDVNMP